MPIRVYFTLAGAHVHCRVFTTGSLCGTLVFTVAEWEATIRDTLARIATVTPEEKTVWP